MTSLAFRRKTPTRRATGHGGVSSEGRSHRVPPTVVLLALLQWLLPAPVWAQQQVSQPQYDIITEKDVMIPMRDGAYLAADVFRPESSEKFPVLMTISIYQKDLDPVLPYGMAPYQHRETPEPDWWVPRGYVQIRVDGRGSGKSLGVTDVWSMQEARDFYDAIEWAGVQEWSNGNVGLAGVSYYAITQWNVASLQPPHLKTIVPWEGFADFYRDVSYQGGIFTQRFFGWWYTHVQGRQLLDVTRGVNSGGINERLTWNVLVHHLDGPWWDEVKARGQFDRIEVPLYSSGNWGGWTGAGHLRGNTEGYTRSASEHKKLEIHIGGHTERFYSEEGKHDQLRWFDYWLKGIDTGVMDEPPVRLCVRTSLSECDWRFENEWPIARTEYTKFYLTADTAHAVEGSYNDGLLSRDAPATEQAVTYSAAPPEFVRLRRDEPIVTFVTEPMTEEIEVTGYVKLGMWVSSTTEDMDIFAYLRKLSADGTSSDTVARGILKVSHRELDPERSLPYRPYHTHRSEQKLRPGEIVPVEVEIWPTSMVFKQGDRIRLDITPFDRREPGRAHYDGTYNLGENTIYVGGDRASYLQLPIVPPKQKDTN